MRNIHRAREQYVIDHTDEECDRRIAEMTKEQILDTMIDTGLVMLSVRNVLRDAMEAKVQDYLADKFNALAEDEAERRRDALREGS